MRILVIGGTQFVGRHAVQQALDGGHDVTLFHRGRTNPDLFPELEHRRGDRTTGDYDALATGTWDAVVDVCAYVPRHVHQLADALGERGGHLVHVSSISSYDEASITPDEDAPLCADLDDPSIEEVTNETYGPLKAMCERAAHARFGAGGVAVVRPTFVAGPHDHSDRFTYWVRRVATGGPIAVVAPDAPFQLVDARDLGAFLVHAGVSGQAGSFDGVGPWASLRDTLHAIAPDGAEPELVDVGSVAASHPLDLPMIVGESEATAFATRPGTEARRHGLATRSVAETAAAIRDWDAERGEPPLRAGPSVEAEAAAVAAVT